MKSFLPGFLLGAAVCAVVFILAGNGGEPPPATSPAPPPGREDPTPEPGHPPPRPLPAPPMARHEPAPKDSAPPFDPGTAVLRIGDGYVFGEARSRSGATGDTGEILCLDISDEVRLRCPHGATPAALPVVYSGERPSVSRAFGLVTDAPERLVGERRVLAVNANGLDSGVLLVEGVGLRAFKVMLVERHLDPHALKRWIRIRYEPVERRAGGGVVALRSAEGTRMADADTIDSVRQELTPPEGLPAGWAGGLPHSPVTVVTRLPSDFVVMQTGTVIVDEPLATKVIVEREATLVLRKGLHPDGEIRASARLGLLVQGNLSGTVESGVGYIHVTGDLTGRLKTHGTAVIDGDVVGVLEVAGIPHVYLRGQVRTPETGLTGGGIPTFFFEQNTMLDVIRRFPDTGGIWKLRVKGTGLPPATYREDIGRWSEVHVGGPVWEKLSR